MKNAKWESPGLENMKQLHAIATAESKFYYTKACSPVKAVSSQNSHFKNTGKICSHLFTLATGICMFY